MKEPRLFEHAYRTEDHRTHTCVDEYVSQIVDSANTILRYWKERGLPCRIVKHSTAPDCLASVAWHIGKIADQVAFLCDGD